MIPGINTGGGGYSGSSSASSGVNSSGKVDNHSVVNFAEPPALQTTRTLSTTVILVLLGLVSITVTTSMNRERRSIHWNPCRISCRIGK